METTQIEVEVSSLDNVVKCEYCDACFYETADLKRHLKLHRYDKLYKCSTCGMNFKTDKQLDIHMKYAEEKSYECYDCGMLFHCELPYKDHVKAVHNKRVRKRVGTYNTTNKDPDEILQTTFQEPNMHINPDAPFNCDICGKLLSSKANLIIHRRIHTGTKPYSCSFCGKSFVQVGHLKSHKRTHTGERPYECKICNKTFVQAVALRNHHLIHSGERPYTCNLCNKSFRQLSHLKIHQRQHTGEKPYKCQFCDKTFRQVGSRDVHEKSHTDERNHHCHICEKSFIQHGHLNAHLKTHVKNNVEICIRCKQEVVISKADGGMDQHLLECTVQPLFTAPFPNLSPDKGSLLLDSSYQVVPSSSTTSIATPRENSPTSENQKRRNVIVMSVEQEAYEKSISKCGICKNEFENLKELSDHFRLHQAYSCRMCQKKFVYLESLRDHFRTVHELKCKEEEKIYVCGECNQHFPESLSLDRHLETAHNASSPSLSKDVTKSSTTAAVAAPADVVFEQPAAANEGKDFQCGECLQKYPTIEVLYQHMEIHKE